MTNNAIRFLSAHNEIEDYLNRLEQSGSHFDFNTLISHAIEGGNQTINYYQHDLRQFGKLRNAIVHTQRQEKIIAEPNEWVVEQIERLVELIINPPIVQAILESKVAWVDSGESVAIALEIMAPRNLSQAPIYHGEEFIGLLTTDTIARWLASNVKAMPVSELCQTSVGEIFEAFTETKDNYSFLQLEATIIEALALFEEYERKGVRLEAIFFTPLGSHSTDIRAIMNTWDVPIALKNIDLASKGN